MCGVNLLQQAQLSADVYKQTPHHRVFDWTLSFLTLSLFSSLSLVFSLSLSVSLSSVSVSFHFISVSMSLFTSLGLFLCVSHLLSLSRKQTDSERQKRSQHATSMQPASETTEERQNDSNNSTEQN